MPDPKTIHTFTAEAQRMPDALTELGDLVTRPGTSIIELPT